MNFDDLFFISKPSRCASAEAASPSLGHPIEAEVSDVHHVTRLTEAQEMARYFMQCTPSTDKAPVKILADIEDCF